MAFKGDNMMNVKRTNRSAILHTLSQYGPISRKRISEILNLTPAAITKLVEELMDEQVLFQGDTIKSESAGRREVMIGLNPKSHVALGILINLRLAIISATNLDGTIIFSEEISIPELASSDELVKMLSSRLKELVNEYSLTNSKIIGLGLAIRGITLDKERMVKDSYGAIDKKNYPIADKFEEATGYKVVLANNVRALFLSQMFFSKDKNINSQFFLRCEYGIGGSLEINGKIWQGGKEHCSEIGHVPVIRHGGKPCHCGKKGCLETISSPMAILEDAKSIFSMENTPILYKLVNGEEKNIGLNEVLDSAKLGDKRVEKILDKAIEKLANALHNLIYIVDPEKIVLYGRIFENEYYLTRLLREIKSGLNKGQNVIIEKSEYNQKLEEKAAGILMVDYFFKNGGKTVNI